MIIKQKIELQIYLKKTSFVKTTITSKIFLFEKIQKT